MDKIIGKLITFKAAFSVKYIGLQKMKLTMHDYFQSSSIKSLGFWK